LKREQERREKIEEITRIEGISPQAAGTATSIAEEAGNASSVGNNRAHSNGGSGKDKYGNDIHLTEGRNCSKKLLCMWQIRAHGPTLQKQEAKNLGGR